MTRPVVALTCYAEPASWGVWRDVPAVLVPAAYVRSLRDAGADVVLLPPAERLGDADAARLLAPFDALVVAGGVDVDPARYGDAAHPTVQSARPDRDDAELALVRAAVAVDLPLLGVCRGMQVMAVAAGGVLRQHLPDEVGTDAHSPAPATYGWNAVRTVGGTRTAAVLGERLEVPCHHHQGVASHPGYEASAHADDGVTEAMEDRSARFRVGVQWHPEAGTDLRIFEALVAAAAASGT
ncbi:MAG TPA: gamma-glutamyl-gamma-aminobutyrate hydrolase family protein [Actinomycetales bacterium]|nr:gamma-glutamyl-gamma-aminobutyrate hydrolase family protein [Actinomycetales bacterium]